MEPSERARRSQQVLAASAIVFAAAGLASFVISRGLAVPSAAAFTLRWTGVFLLAAWATTKRSLTGWILVALIAGAAVGHDAPEFAVKLQVLAGIFLRLIKTIIAPLIFATLVVGIAGHADLRKVGRMGIKSLVYFEIVSTIALLIGFAAIGISRAGEGVQLTAAAETPATQLAPHATSDLILNAFPENIAKAVAEGQVLQIVIFSVLFALALNLVPEAKRRPMLGFCESLSEIMFRFTNLVMYAAPVGVFGAIAYTVGHLGFGVLLPLAKLLGTMYAALLVFLLGVLLPIALMARIPVMRFLRAVAEPAAIAFGTSSSEAALPLAMEEMEGMGVPRPIVAFVMPTGYSFNLDGSSLYQSLALVFVAQAAGIHLSLTTQVMMMLTLLLTSKGTAGVARASLVIVLAAVTQFRLPVEPFYLLFAIDPLMDMARTTVNVVGNCLATTVIARWEGDFPAEAPSSNR